jgi:hypothetical protein
MALGQQQEERHAATQVGQDTLGTRSTLSVGGKDVPTIRSEGRAKFGDIPACPSR